MSVWTFLAFLPLGHFVGNPTGLTTDFSKSDKNSNRFFFSWLLVTDGMNVFKFVTSTSIFVKKKRDCVLYVNN